MKMRSGLATVAAVAALSACGSGSLPLLPSAGGGAAGAAEDSRSSAMSAMPYFSVHYSLSDDFKDDLPDKAKAYELESTTDEGAVVRVAKAFGVTGDVKSTADEWVVAAGDRNVRVSKLGGLPFSLDGDRAVSSGYACAEPASPTDPSETQSPPPPDQPVKDGATTSGMPAPDNPRCDEPQRNPDLPTRAAAEKIGRDALTAAGLDLDGAKVTADGGFDSWNVTVQHNVGGTITSGVASSVLIGPKGRVLAAHGLLGRHKALGEYPLVSAKAAVARLNAQQGGGALRGGREPALGAPEPAIATDEAKCGDPNVMCAQDMPLDAPTMPVPTEPQTREIVLTKATPALMMVGGFDRNASAHLVPAFVFTSEDDGEVQVEAATDEYIQKPAKDLPADDPTPLPPDSGSGGGGRGGSDGESCTASASATDAPNGAGPPNAPLELEVCASDGEVKVGEQVTFRVTAKDADGSFVNGPCEFPISARFGDEADGDETAMCMACAQATEGKHELAETLKHTYDKPGRYSVDVTSHSGSSCDPRPGDSKGAVSLTIEVSA